MIKYSFLLKNIIFEEESIFSSLKIDLENINKEFKKINKHDVPSDFIKQWEHYLKIMNINIDKYEVDKLIENIKDLKKSYILNWTLPHKSLESIINHKNILLNNVLNKISIMKDGYISGDFSNLPYERSNYLSNLYEENSTTEPTLIEEINQIINQLKDYNDDKLVKDFIETWYNDCDFIKNKILKDQLEKKDIKEIQNIINEIINSLVFYFIVPHKELQQLLNILTLKDKYIFIFKK